MRTKLLACALFVATASVVIAYPLRPNTPAATPVVPAVAAVAHRPKVEVAFVLDTTGSMGGLIQAAKENIWSIANGIATGQPTPEVRMGLVAFRDRGDDYVTRVVDLSPDLDTMYATLMDFQANGGGDGPESVNQALHDAVTKLSWSQDPKSYKVIFLVGDAPPHMDYPDDVKYPDVIRMAKARGIVVNTIQAGDDSSTRAEWEEIASLNQGAYFQVAQNGNAVAVATPFDEQLASLSRDLDDTRLFYGDAGQRRALAMKEAATAKLHAGGSAASRAKRAEYNASAAGAANLAGEQELVDAVSSGRVDLGKVAKSDLPESLQGLDKDAQAKVVRENATKRTELRAQIADLSAQRQAYIADELKKKGGAEESLDARIHSAVKQQAATKGLKYSDEVKY